MLSIQSHVVSGYCGNKSATFPLQLLEFEVDVINTVQLSNHTQYKVARGQIFQSQDVEDLHEGLKANNLLRLYDNILSGYVANASYIESMKNLIQDIKDERRKNGLDCWYTFDPVLGDDGTGFYVPNSTQVMQAYKANLLPLADIVTPNRFEASVLTGIDIDSSSDSAMEQAMEAMDVFHDMGIRVVVITSFQVASEKDQLVCILSYRPIAGQDGDTNDEANPRILPEAYVIRIPKLDYPFTGTGDLFAALLTGWLRITDFNFKKSFENTANSIHEVLEDTLNWYKHVDDGSVQSLELRLVQNKKRLICPKQIRFIADKIVFPKRGGQL